MEENNQEIGYQTHYHVISVTTHISDFPKIFLKDIDAFEEYARRISQLQTLTDSSPVESKGNNRSGKTMFKDGSCVEVYPCNKICLPMVEDEKGRWIINAGKLVAKDMLNRDHLAPRTYENKDQLLDQYHKVLDTAMFLRRALWERDGY